MVSTVDKRMGQVMNHLEKLGLYENTMFVFLSDNGHSCEFHHITGDGHKSGLPKGFEYGANGGGGNTGKWYGKKGTYFEGGVRIPFVISYPKMLPANQVRDQIVRETDLLPTICDILDIRLPEKRMDGATLLPIIEEDAKSHHEVLFWNWNTSWAVRKGEWKLIVNGYNPPDVAKGENWKNNRLESPCLVNLSGEEPEKINYADQYPEIIEEYTRLHKQWFNDED